MNLSLPFIRRPVMTTLVMLALVLLGALSYSFLPVSNLPNVDFPTIQVMGSLPGANPETMAAAVATPLERQFSSIPGLDSMTSSSAHGTTQVTLQFSLDRPIDAAGQDVQTAIAAAGSQLPPGMPSPPTYRKVNPAEQPILMLSVNSQTLPLSQVDEYAQSTLAQRLSSINGVAQVNIYGSQKYAVRIQVDPQALLYRGIGIDEVATAVQQANSSLPVGAIYGSHRTLSLKTDAPLMKAAAFRPIVVAYRNGAPVHLDEIASVLDSVENDKLASWYKDTRGVVLAIQRQPGSNTIAVVEAVERMLPSLRAQIPAAVNVETVINRSQTIRASVHDVQLTLMLTMGFVVFVIFLFVRSLWATLIPSLALPVAIVATFAVMKACNFNLDSISLMALTLSTGFVVDDAIVMLENIVRRMERGESAKDASIKGAKEIGFTILAMTISLVAVFIPILFMGGILGRLFNEFAITISAAILISGFVSLSLTPLLCSRFLKPHAGHGMGRFGKVLEGSFDSLLRVYEVGLRWVLGHRGFSLGAFFAILGLTVYLFAVVPKGFIPNEDIDQLMVSTEAVQGISFSDMVERQKAAAAILGADPNISGYSYNVGPNGRNPTANQGSMFVRLKPRSERKLSADQVVEQLRPKLAKVPGIRVFIQNPPSIRIGGQMSKSMYQLTLSSPDLDELYRETPRLEAKLREMSELQDVTSDLQLRNPELRVEIDRTRAAALGISAQGIEMALGSAFGSRQISQIYAPNNTYKVIMEVAPAFQQDPDALSLLNVRSSSGKLVPLTAIAQFSMGSGPVQVAHLGQMPSTTLSFNLKQGGSLSDATAKVNEVARETLSEGVQASFKGTAQVFQESLRSLSWLLLVAIVVIYIVLGILYESFIHPLTVLSGLPSAGLGALLTLMLFQQDLNLYAFVGLIMLIGIVKKNAIILIDFAIEARKVEGKTAEEAIFSACMVRFRPIMMTTMAALVGSLPIALGLGAGGDSRQSMGLAVFGGLLVSQLLTLFITPVIYLALEGKDRPSDKLESEASSLVSAG